MSVYKEKEKISLANIKTPAENANYRWLKKMTMGSYTADEKQKLSIHNGYFCLVLKPLIYNIALT